MRDVVVIGGRYSGLVCAAYLAREALCVEVALRTVLDDLGATPRRKGVLAEVARNLLEAWGGYRSIRTSA